MSAFITRLSGGAGARVAVRDMIDMAGLPSTVGCRTLARRAVPAGADAACLAGFRRAEQAGELRFVGRTNLNELAFGIDGVNPSTAASPSAGRAEPTTTANHTETPGGCNVRSRCRRWADRRRHSRRGRYVPAGHHRPFGPDDQTGMLDLITPDSMWAAVSRADAGHTLDLSVDYFIDMIGMPSFTAAGQPPYQIGMTSTPRGTVLDDPVAVGPEQNARVSYSGDAITMYTHCGTHFDSLNHFGYRNKIWNGFDADQCLGARHWTVCGADRQPPIIGRGVLLDVAALRAVDTLPGGYGVGEQDLRDAARHEEVELRASDIVLVRTGQMTLWPDAAFSENEPGLTREGAEFLARQGAIVVGADNLALEQIPSTEEGNWLPVHNNAESERGISQGGWGRGPAQIAGFGIPFGPDRASAARPLLRTVTVGAQASRRTGTGGRASARRPSTRNRGACPSP